MHRFPSTFPGHWVLSLDPRLRTHGIGKSARPFFLYPIWVSVDFMFRIINPKEVALYIHTLRNILMVQARSSWNSFEENFCLLVIILMEATTYYMGKGVEDKC